jgi:hypothetical protein
MILQKAVRTIIVVSSLVAAQAAHAALVDCPDSFTDNPGAKVEDDTGLVSAASACQILTPADNSNVASVDNINDANFFDSSNWSANGGNLQLDVASSTGTWSIDAANFAAFDYMIVFKSGKGTNLTGFLLNELFASGVWSTPFTSPPFTFNGKVTSRDVSHYTIVQRPGTPPVDMPEPGILGLLGIGLAGYAAARRRR